MALFWLTVWFSFALLQALLDTVLVLGIVAVTGSLLFGLNVALADASQWWYSL
jgi:hypothetical protein